MAYREVYNTNLRRAYETRSDHFWDNVHQSFRFIDNGIDFSERGRFTNCRIFNGELQLLHVRRHLIQLLEQFFLLRTNRNLERATNRVIT